MANGEGGPHVGIVHGQLLRGRGREVGYLFDVAYGDAHVFGDESRVKWCGERDFERSSFFACDGFAPRFESASKQGC